MTSPAAAPFITLPENELAVAAIARLGELGSERAPRTDVEVVEPAETETETRRWESTQGLVYLYGASGLGKSHLVQQFLGNEAGRSGGQRVLHLLASELIDRLDVALAAGQVPGLREEFLQLDVFVGEDLAALQRKKETQRLLIAAMDETLARRGRVLLTGSIPPGEFEGMLPRLVNRLHGGACVGLALPGIASRHRLLLEFARQRKMSLPEEQARVLAEALAVSPRELRAAVAHLDKAAKQAGVATVNQALVEQALASLVVAPAPEIGQIAKAVAREFGLSVTTLRRGGRTASSTLPRHVAMTLARELTDHSLEQIAGYFGRQNHGTVIHARKKLRARLADDPDLRRHVRRIRQRLGLEAR